MNADIRPFRLAVDESALADLKRRLAHVRWPDERPRRRGPTAPPSRSCASSSITGRTATTGAARSRAQRVAAVHDLDRRDRRALHPRAGARTESASAAPIARLARLGAGVHEAAAAAHRSRGARRRRGRCVHGGRALATRLHARRSSPTSRAGRCRRSARSFHTLMTRLGYARYGAQGGDWGSFVTGWLAANRADALTGIHLNMMPLRRDASMFADPTSDERTYLDELNHFLKEETGYQWIQGTRPQTLASRSAIRPPASPRGSPRSTARGPTAAATRATRSRSTRCSATRACTGSPAASARRSGRTTRACTARGRSTADRRADRLRAVPARNPPPAAAAAERVFTDIRRWSVMPKGGHFAAWEQPQALAQESARSSGRSAERMPRGRRTRRPRRFGNGHGGPRPCRPTYFRKIAVILPRPAS